MSAPTQLHWDAEPLWRSLAPVLPGISVEVRAEVDSTSTRLVEHARAAEGRRAGDLAPLLLVAEAQSAGRGRLGRGWASTRGRSLTFSLGLVLDPADWGGLSLAVGVALAEALEPRRAGVAPRIGLKWPNDLWLLDAAAPNGIGRKLGGVLVETVAVSGQRWVVVGVGLNVLAPEITGAPPTHGVGTLGEIDPFASAPRALAAVALPLAEALVRFEREGLAPFADAWAARDVLAGHAVRVDGAGVGLLDGVAEGLDADGALRLRSADGRVHRVLSGEASVRLREPA